MKDRLQIISQWLREVMRQEENLFCQSVAVSRPEVNFRATWNERIFIQPITTDRIRRCLWSMKIWWALTNNEAKDSWARTRGSTCLSVCVSAGRIRKKISTVFSMSGAELLWFIFAWALGPSEIWNQTSNKINFENQSKISKHSNKCCWNIDLFLDSQRSNRSSESSLVIDPVRWEIGRPNSSVWLF